MTNMKKQFSALFTAMVLLMLAVFPQSSITANAAEAESISAESVSAKETYHMKIWLSTTPMGSELTSLDQLYPNFPVYLCCKVTNSSDQIVVNGLEYSVDLTVTNPDGTLLQSTTYDTAHSYSSDGKDYYAGYNWIHPILKDLGKYQYKAVMKVDGTDFMTCKVNFTVKQFNVRLDSWVSLSEYGDKTGDKLAPLPKGVKSYICYRLIDKDTKQIAEALSGYTVERKIYLPDGTLFKSDTNESKAQSYNSPKLSTPGKWKVEYTLSGTLKLSYTDYFYVDPAYPVVDKTTESVGADKFTWGEDNWQFSNTTDAFTTGYDVRNDVMYDLLEMTALPNIDREIMLRLPALAAKRNVKRAENVLCRPAHVLVKHGRFHRQRHIQVGSMIFHRLYKMQQSAPVTGQRRIMNHKFRDSFLSELMQAALKLFRIELIFFHAFTPGAQPKKPQKKRPEPVRVRSLLYTVQIH